VDLASNFIKIYESTFSNLSEDAKDGWAHWIEETEPNWDILSDSIKDVGIIWNKNDKKGKPGIPVISQMYFKKFKERFPGSILQPCDECKLIGGYVTVLVAMMQGEQYILDLKEDYTLNQVKAMKKFAVSCITCTCALGTAINAKKKPDNRDTDIVRARAVKRQITSHQAHEFIEWADCTATGREYKMPAKNHFQEKVPFKEGMTVQQLLTGITENW